MTRNIIFAADEALIEGAREAARADDTPLNEQLNEQFRLRLEQCLHPQRVDRAMATVGRLRGGDVWSGAVRLECDEMNERR